MPFKRGDPKPANSGRKRGSLTDPLTIEYWPIDRLKPYDRNPRKNDKAVTRMADSIRQIDPGYCDVIVERFQNLTGKKAVLA